MARYLWQVNYTQEGLKGLIKEGGSKRQKALEKTLKSLGGKVEAFYYVFGDSDVITIAELPDNVSIAAGALAINATGAAVVKTSILLTPKEIDAACKKSCHYRPPGE